MVEVVQLPFQASIRAEPVPDSVPWLDDSDLDGGPCLCACAQWRQCTAQWSIL